MILERLFAHMSITVDLLVCTPLPKDTFLYEQKTVFHLSGGNAALLEHTLVEAEGQD
jgi:hypothetical protein